MQTERRRKSSSLAGKAKKQGASFHHPILVIDDNPDDVTLALEALKKNSVPNPIVVMQNGEEALDYLLPRTVQSAEGEVLPALVLLDLHLPRISGVEVLRRLRMNARTRLLAVVIFTTSKEKQDLLDCYLSGANSYVCKPANFSDCVLILGRLVDYWLRLNVQPPVPYPSAATP